MRPGTWCWLAGAAFGVVAIAHAVRAILGVQVLVGGLEIPVWVSWPGAAGAGALSAMGIAAARRGRAG
ncbi:hypothetical protein JW921_01580 [Candidatus Fermentibacterales bacterium]|nr:hypothetical protein [Candidatus Fermentibacterales bacterium]